MARRTREEDSTTVWKGSKYKTTTPEEKEGIYGTKHVNAFQAGAKRMRDPSTLYRSKFFQRTGKVPTQVPDEFLSETKNYRKAARKANIATVGAVVAASNVAYYVHPIPAALGFTAVRYGKSRYLAGHKQNIHDILETHTGKKQSKAVLGGYYTRTVKGKRQRVKMPKS